MPRLHGLVLVLVLGVAACAAPPPPPDVAVTAPPPALPAPQVEQPIYRQTGIASWYGPRHQGHRTANGERFDMHKMTAAHRHLAFGTVVRVTCLETGRMVKVRINDRGPYVGGRIIDLSAAAGKALGIRDDGITRVRLEVYASDQ